MKLNVEAACKVAFRFLESTGGAAFITVVLGGLLGQWVSCSIQQSLKDREFQQAWLQARGNQALAAYEEYLEQERGTIERVYQLVGDTISSAENLISLTGLLLDLEGFSGDEYKRVSEQRVKLREAYNVSDAQWRSQQQVLALLMGYYHQAQPAVEKQWRQVARSVNAYKTCAEKWYAEHFDKPGPTAAACRRRKDAVLTRLQELTVTLEATRLFAWDGYDSPQNMRRMLDSEQ